MKKENIVWKDNLLKLRLLSIFFVFFVLSLTYLVFMSEGNSAKVFYIIVVISLLYLIYRVIKFRRNYVTKRGIFVQDKYTHEGIFLNWNKILNITIMKRYVSTGKYTSSHKELEIKTKNKEKPKCIIFDPHGFVQALKKLNKIHLVDKKSREKYETTKE